MYNDVILFSLVDCLLPHVLELELHFLQPQAPLSTVACVQHHRAQGRSVNGPREMVTMTTAQSHVVMTTGEGAPC